MADLSLLIGFVAREIFLLKVVFFLEDRTENESLEVFTEIRGCCGIVSGLVISPGFRYYRIRQPHSLLHPPTFLTTATSTSTIISTSTPTKKINININPFMGFGNRPIKIMAGESPPPP